MLLGDFNVDRRTEAGERLLMQLSANINGTLHIHEATHRTACIDQVMTVGQIQVQSVQSLAPIWVTFIFMF